MTRITRTSRLRLAVTFAVAYALCVLAPPVALALSDGSAAFHCLTDRHSSAAAHVHDAKTAGHTAAGHDHGGNADHHQMRAGGGDNMAGANGLFGTCCGYFCLSAMPGSPTPAIVLTLHGLPALAAVDNSIDGCGPDRIDRPPIALLSL